MCAFVTAFHCFGWTFNSFSLSLSLCYVKSDVYFTRRLHIISIQMVCVECHDMCTIIYNIYDY